MMVAIIYSSTSFTKMQKGMLVLFFFSSFLTSLSMILSDRGVMMSVIGSSSTAVPCLVA